MRKVRNFIINANIQLQSTKEEKAKLLKYTDNSYIHKVQKYRKTTSECLHIEVKKTDIPYEKLIKN